MKMQPTFRALGLGAVALTMVLLGWTFLLTNVQAAGEAAGTDAAVDERPWKLVWADEFDYEGLPDPEKWDYEYGFVRNHESQYYTRGRLENARVADGKLIIECRKETYPNAAYDPQSNRWQRQREQAAYTSASVITQDRASWLYGRVEVRAKLPSGQGAWPAIWMMGINRREVGWPRCGEIDIMEWLGRQPDIVHGTVHWPGDNRHQSHGGRIRVEQDVSSTFNIYAIEWAEDYIDFYFNDQRYHRFPVARADQEDGSNPFRKPHYLLINFALGGGWGGDIDDSVLPQQYVIDYVRVYQREEAER